MITDETIANESTQVLIEMIRISHDEIIKNANNNFFNVGHFIFRDRAVKELAKRWNLNLNSIPFNDRNEFSKWFQRLIEEIEVPITNDYLKIISNDPTAAIAITQSGGELVHEKIRAQREISFKKVKESLEYFKLSSLKKPFKKVPDESIYNLLAMIHHESYEEFLNLEKMINDSNSEMTANEKLFQLAYAAMKVFKENIHPGDQAENKKIINRFFQQHQLPFAIQKNAENKFEIVGYSKPVSFEKLRKRALKKQMDVLAQIISLPSGILSGGLLGANMSLIYLPLFFSGVLIPIGVALTALTIFVAMYYATQKNSAASIRTYTFKGFQHLFKDMSTVKKIAMAFLIGLAIIAGGFFLFSLYSTAITFLGLIGFAMIASNPVTAVLVLAICAMAAVVFTFNLLIDVSNFLKSLKWENVETFIREHITERSWSEMSHKERAKALGNLLKELLIRVPAILVAVLACIPILMTGQTNYFSAVTHFSNAISLSVKIPLVFIMAKVVSSISFISNLFSYHDVWEIISNNVKSAARAVGKVFDRYKIISKESSTHERESLLEDKANTSFEKYRPVEIEQRVQPKPIITEGTIKQGKLLTFFTEAKSEIQEAESKTENRMFIT